MERDHWMTPGQEGSHNEEGGENESGRTPVHSEGHEQFGEDVTIRNFWVRHAQKKSGEVFNAAATGLSTSSISPKGAEMSQEFGATIEALPDGAKGYVSNSPRTTETVENILDGYQKKNPDAPIRKLRLREQLTTADQPADFLKLYDTMFSAEKNRILVERGIAPEAFSTLSPDEQQEIAEAAEEPVIREWVDNPESNLAQLYPPETAAARFAALFNRRHQRMADKLHSGSEVDLFHLTHKSVTEPFLASGVLVRKSDGTRITKLEQIGGSMTPLDEWESVAHTDNDGQPSVTVTIRGEEYSLDSNRFAELLAAAEQRKRE